MTEPVVAPPVVRRGSSRARWAVPAVVAAAVVAAFAAPPLLASADSAGLPAVTAKQLIANVAAAKPQAMSGTAVYTARLGLPNLVTEQVSGANPISLLGGSSTIKVWTDGDERMRTSLLGTASEYSVVRDGPEAWTYSSTDDAVVHYTLDAAGKKAYSAAIADARSGKTPDVVGDIPTPDEAATQLLDHVSASASVTVDQATVIAGRDAYQLVITPRGTDSLVARVVIGVDATTSTPLRVQVWSSTDPGEPAIEVGFTDVNFSAPDNAVLDFTAPAGAQARDVVVPLPVVDPAEAAKAADAVKTAATAADGTIPASALPAGVALHGDGFATVVEVSQLNVLSILASGGSGADVASSFASKSPTFGSSSAQALIKEFTTDGSGSPAGALDTGALFNQLTTVVPEGRLFTSALVSVLITNDGRVLAGAVPPETLRSLA